MVRPAAEILLSTQETDCIGWDILKAEGQWIVLYKDQPVSIRSRHWTIEGENPKYRRTSYPLENSAEKFAAKLNEIFQTTEFTVRKIL